MTQFYKSTSTNMKTWKITLKIQRMNDDTSFTESQFSSANINFKRVQGVEWHTESDSFVFQFYDLIKLAESLKPTKTNILKVFYDSLGFIAHVTA